MCICGAYFLWFFLNFGFTILNVRFKGQVQCVSILLTNIGIDLQISTL